jgi:hypothetical protein
VSDDEFAIIQHGVKAEKDEPNARDAQDLAVNR